MDYYAILGINRDADVADVQKACAHRRALWGSGSRGSGGQIAFNCSRSSSQQLGADRRACCCCRYRNLALKWHPLRCDEADAQSNFDEVSEAFEVLSDCESRLPPR